MSAPAGERAVDGDGEKHLSDRHRAITPGPAAWAAVAGGILIALAYVVSHLAWLETLERRPAGVSTAGFVLAEVSLPQETLVEAARKGTFPLLPTAPPTLSLDEAKAFKLGRGKFLVVGDPVIGVVFGGQARAYPLRFMDFHEVVNDTVGDVPIAVVWSPLSGSAAVFARRVGGSRIELEPSGLLSNCSSLLVDRGDPPSLFSAVHAKAVAGPAAKDGMLLERLPFTVMRWADWQAAHPETRVLKPAPELVKAYKTSPYGKYLGSDDLKFPASPLPPGPLPKKTPVLAVTAGGQRLVYSLPFVAKQADTHGNPWKTTQGGVALEFRFWPGSRSDNPPTAVVTAPGGEPVEVLPSFWFAWHAAHPDDALAQ